MVMISEAEAIRNLAESQSNDTIVKDAQTATGFSGIVAATGDDEGAAIMKMNTGVLGISPKMMTSLVKYRIRIMIRPKEKTLIFVRS